MCRVSFIWVCRLPNPYARDVPCVIGLACPNDPNGVLQQAKVIRRLWGNLDIRKFARECSKILRTILNMCVLSPDPFRNCVNFPPFRNCMDFCCRQVVLAPLEMAFSYSRTISSLTWATELQNVADMAGIWCIHTDTHPTHTHTYIYIYIYIPIESMYGIYANIWGILMVNVTIYSIHGSYGIYIKYNVIDSN